MPLSRKQAEALFAPYAVGLWSAVVEHGFDRYKKQPGKADHRSGTMANLIHDFMVSGAQKVFADDVADGRVRFISVPGTDITLMEIEESAIVWFKKLSAGRRASQNRTGLSARLAKGDCDDIPGVAPAATLVHAGYTPNSLHTAVARVSVVRPSLGRAPEWYIDIERPAISLVRASRSNDRNGDGPRTALKLILSPRQSKLIE